MLGWVLLISSSTILADNEILRLYSAITVRDSGLAAAIVPAFEKETGIFVEVQYAATGKALKAGRLGKTDLLWVHAPDAEKQFVSAGYADKRIETMHNDFVIVGPANDPAGIQTAPSITKALLNIYKQKSRFVSRGDDSGTHKKELSLWKTAKINPFGLWYYEAGAGMKRALLEADKQNAYTLVDRGTWLANKHLFKLTILNSGDAELINTYSLVCINPEKYPNTNKAASKKFIQFITRGKGRDIIAKHTIAGENLFKINSVKNNP